MEDMSLSVEGISFAFFRFKRSLAGDYGSSDSEFHHPKNSRILSLFLGLLSIASPRTWGTYWPLRAATEPSDSTALLLRQQLRTTAFTPLLPAC
jgi:hypothetical protein